MSHIRLSPRERQILIMLASGHTLRSVAIELGLSERTVRNTVGSAFKRLRANNRAEAFMELGWLTPPEA